MKKNITKRDSHYYIVGDCVVQGLVRRTVLKYCGTDQEEAVRIHKEIKNYPPRDCVGNITLVIQ